MKYIKYFEANEDEGYLEIKDLFREYADNLFLTEIKDPIDNSCNYPYFSSADENAGYKYSVSDGSNSIISGDFIITIMIDTRYHQDTEPWCWDWVYKELNPFVERIKSLGYKSEIRHPHLSLYEYLYE